MTELKPCPVCGKKATVIHLYDRYDNFDFGWTCGCPAYCNEDGVHDKPMRVASIISAKDAVKKWNRMVEKYDRT